MQRSIRKKERYIATNNKNKKFPRSKPESMIIIKKKYNAADIN